MDLVTAPERERALSLLRTLNPGADVLPATRSSVDLRRVIDTGRFSMDKAARSAGWLKVRGAPPRRSGVCSRGDAGNVLADPPVFPYY